MASVTSMLASLCSSSCIISLPQLRAATMTMASVISMLASLRSSSCITCHPRRLFPAAAVTTVSVISILASLCSSSCITFLPQLSAATVTMTSVISMLASLCSSSSITSFPLPPILRGRGDDGLGDLDAGVSLQQQLHHLLTPAPAQPR
jgi:hypothetical protein